MSRDYGEVEREFLAGLGRRTGRSLDEWMAAIDEAGLADKNAIIDWLRPQGFTFAHASWLERIHHNGGRPVYGSFDPDEADQEAYAARQHNTIPSQKKPLEASKGLGKTRDGSSDLSTDPIEANDNLPQDRDRDHVGDNDNDSEVLNSLIARGKAYQPLARLVIDDIRKILPTARVFAGNGLIQFANPDSFAALQVSGKGLKFGLALGDGEPPAGFQTMRLAGDGRAHILRCASHRRAPC